MYQTHSLNILTLFQVWSPCVTVAIPHQYGRSPMVTRSYAPMEMEPREEAEQLNFLKILTIPLTACFPHLCPTTPQTRLRFATQTAHAGSKMKEEQTRALKTRRGHRPSSPKGSVPTWRRLCQPNTAQRKG